MRDLEFRGLRADDGGWVYGLLRKQRERIVSKSLKSVAYTGGWDYFIDSHEEPCGSWLVASESIGQYAGRKDKNGNKIFEGDLYYDSYNNLCVVTFHNGCFCVKMISDSDYSNYLINEIENDDCKRIIGNIHSNPGLLNQTK